MIPLKHCNNWRGNTGHRYSWWITTNSAGITKPSKISAAVQPYYAVKANPDPGIVKTLYDIGASFDVASFPEFMIVHENIKKLPYKKRQDWIWDKIIYANPIKAEATLRKLNQYKILVTYDNREEIDKIRQFAPKAGLVLRIKVPNTGAMSELSTKFGTDPGKAVDLILEADRAGLTVEGLSFHVGSQSKNIENYVQAINLSANVFEEAAPAATLNVSPGYRGGFPCRMTQLSYHSADWLKINAELDRLFPKDIQILAEPGRFMVATAGIAVAEIIGKAVRKGKLCYYINDGVYHTFSGVIFDHCRYRLQAFKQGKKQICTVFGPTCDALDVVSMAAELPGNLIRGDLLYSRNIGAYSVASSTRFNGFPPAKIVHVNQ